MRVEQKNSILTNTILICSLKSMRMWWNIRDDGTEMGRRKNGREVYQREATNSAEVQFRFEMEMSEAGNSCKRNQSHLSVCASSCGQCGKESRELTMPRTERGMLKRALRMCLTTKQQPLWETVGISTWRSFWNYKVKSTLRG